MMAPFRLLLAAILLMAPASVSAQTSTQDVTIDEIVNRLLPVIHKTGQGARLSFDGTCPGDGLLVTMEFPRIRVRPVSPGATGILAVREMFPEGTRIEERGGVITISLTSVPQEILQLPLSPMQLSRVEQFQGVLAVMAIDENVGLQAGLRELGYSRPAGDMSVLIGTWPDDRPPHLPATLSNLTLDQALDDVARTFGSVILFGICKPRQLYLVTSRGGYDWTAPHPTGASPHE